MTAREHRTPAGAILEPKSDIRFRLWAPDAETAGLFLDGGRAAFTTRKTSDGWHELLTQEAKPGSFYQYVLRDGMIVPYPASHFQPDDGEGPSEVIDPASYDSTVDWSCRDWVDVILCEIHIGAFTAEGAVRAAIEKLDHLACLGVPAIEITPVSDFPDRRNWGYDGVLLYAPDSYYGRLEDSKALVEAAHARGIAALPDVVYSHFGPNGNHLPLCASAFFAELRHTPRGAAINYDGCGSKPVREFVIHNALYWPEEFNLDGLRFDAAPAIIDEGAKHLLDELGARAPPLADRPIHLLLENQENDARWLFRQVCAPTHYTAQWNDDLHHVPHVAATHERARYYADYQGRTDLLAKALAEGFAYQGQTMSYSGSPRRTPSGSLPPGAFVAFIQNHDQIGNRAFGDRLGVIAPANVMRALFAVYQLLPQAPMIFIGEEWAARQPFPFFCDFDRDLADAVREGRREEFARCPEFADPEQRGRIPDPLAAATFRAAKLNWNLIDAAHLRRYQALLLVRKRKIAPLLKQIKRSGAGAVYGEGAVEVQWRNDFDETRPLSANLSEKPVELPPAPGRSLWCEGDCGPALGPWSVRWSVETPR